MAERVNTINIAYFKQLWKLYGINRSEYLLLKYIARTTGSDGWSHARLKTIANDLGRSVKAKFISKLMKRLSHERYAHSRIISPLLERKNKSTRLLFQWDEDSYKAELGGYLTAMVGAQKESGLTLLQHNVLRIVENYARKQGYSCNYHNQGIWLSWTDISRADIANKVNIKAQNVKRMIDRLRVLRRIDTGAILDSGGSIICKKAIIILEGVLDIEAKYELPMSRMTKRNMFNRNRDDYRDRINNERDFEEEF